MNMNDESIDAARYRWLKKHYIGYEYGYGSPPEAMVAFNMPVSFKPEKVVSSIDELEIAIDADIRNAQI